MLGETGCGIEMNAGRVKLLLLAADASESSRRAAERMLAGHRALPVELPYSKAELSQLLGSGNCAVTALCDIGLAAAFMQALAETDAERYGKAAAEVKRRSEKAAKRKAAGPHRKQGGNQV